jgi:hypothetical protein
MSETLKGDVLPGSDRLPRQGGTTVAGQVRVVPARYPGRTLGSVAAGAAIAAILWSVLENPRWGWGVFAEWFFSAPVLAGLGRTSLLTLLGSVSGFALGTVLAVARVAERRKRRTSETSRSRGRRVRCAPNSLRTRRRWPCYHLLLSPRC